MQLYQFTVTTYIGTEEVKTHHYVAAPDLQSAQTYAGTFTASLHGEAEPIEDDWNTFQTPRRRWKLDSLRPVHAITDVPGTDDKAYTFPVFSLSTISRVLAGAVRALESADWLLAPSGNAQSLFNNEIVHLRSALNGLGSDVPSVMSTTPGRPASYAQAVSAIRGGFQEWISEPVRARSPEVDFGCWWVLKHPRDWPKWRVSLIVDTREVYAVALEGHQPDKFIPLGKVPGAGDVRAEMEGLMQGWAESDMRVPDLFGRFLMDEERPHTEQPPTTMHANDSTDIRLMSKAQVFETLFTEMPDHKHCGGHLEVGEFDGCSEYEWETDLEFMLGPDGHVWAKIGGLDLRHPRPEGDGLVNVSNMVSHFQAIHRKLLTRSFTTRSTT
jgi:hypothetical protein